ncbi:MAG TPA: hypothetical protein VFW00_02825 [Rhodocyclaceae bacterium]|nr:hypothetical protein [Rhodocyclaceae bacterium]
MKQLNERPSDRSLWALFIAAMVAAVLVESTGTAIAGETWQDAGVAASAGDDVTVSHTTGGPADVRPVLADAENGWPIPTCKVIVRPPYKPDKTGTQFVSNDFDILDGGVVYEQ